MTARTKPSLTIFCGADLESKLCSDRDQFSSAEIYHLGEHFVHIPKSLDGKLIALQDSNVGMDTQAERINTLLVWLRLLIKCKGALRFYTNDPIMLYVINNCLQAGRIKKALPTGLDYYPKLKSAWVKAFYRDKPGHNVSVMDPATGLIDVECLDTIVSVLGMDFERLCDLEG